MTYVPLSSGGPFDPDPQRLPIFRLILGWSSQK